ncbi:hypothetical protein SAMN05443637_101374 [Pseudonocardia thermophila]|jgi:membrane protein AbrB duplication|uniref:Ammonia monooxygenase n=1 Tax=Pseudonocardia thermophila TaxID=1848 RepID=A0A1M6NP94_PSETH|nr:AbrB family transcriptional regulator [Pseudonocardia thermophila]SHJ97446.1 hypothetical protein SAMN05443637_101374 [Pseudonocardia thermophila]
MTAALGRWAVLIVLTAAVAAALIAASVPTAALFAGLLVATCLALAGRAPARVPRPAFVCGQAVIGVVIGLMASPDTLAGLAQDWLPVLLISVATLVLSSSAGLLLGLRRGVSALTGMFALTAGGASGMVAMSRELGADDRVVVVAQYLRAGLVAASTPLVAMAFYGAAVGVGAPAGPAGAPWWQGLLVLAICVGAGIPLARLTRMPSGGLLGPMLVAIALNLAGLVPGVTVPTLVVDLGYAVIGWQAGIGFTRSSLKTVLGALPAMLALIVAVSVACAGLGLALSALTGASLLDGYLATTPGGVYAALATAISSGSDVTFVVAVQVLRVILLLLVTPLLARLANRRAGVGATNADTEDD